MKKIILILCVAAFAVSCGSKNNKVSSSSTVSGSEGLEVGAMYSNFTGEYDILRRDSNDCSNTIRIESACNGLMLKNFGFTPDEEFCNINTGAKRISARNDEFRTPPNPDRHPPTLDRNDQNGESKIVTLEGNVLRSVLRINERISFTSTLMMNDNGILVKVSDLKRGQSRCIYQKRL